MDDARDSLESMSQIVENKPTTTCNQASRIGLKVSLERSLGNPWGIGAGLSNTESDDEDVDKTNPVSTS
jgi:hypothetical protein